MPQAKVWVELTPEELEDLDEDHFVKKNGLVLRRAQ